MIISIASGKGGTGKTTVSTNLAAAAKEKITFLDCDVEEPNAHLFLHPSQDNVEDVHTLVPKINQGKCNHCRKCVDICRFGAITLIGETILLFPEMCHGCGGCMAVCEQNAISEGAKILGKITSGRRGSVEFHSGEMNIGEAMSPPLIKALRRRYETSVNDVIIDAPPGTSCPAIASMYGADYVVLVTEPTPFGHHDLVLAHQTVLTLGIDCGLIINRAGLGDERVEQYASDNNIPILLQIPFSRQVAEMYSRGTLLVESDESWAQVFAGLLEKIRRRNGVEVEEI